MNNMEKEKILITGVTGFVGSHMLDFLVKNTNSQIFGLKRMNSQLRNIHHAIDKIELLDGDLNDQASMLKIIETIKPDKVYHFGALSWVSPSWSMPSIYMQTNVIGTINLFEAYRTVGISPRTLISCTPEEFGDVPEHMLPITEDTRIHPINPYAASKAAQDMISVTYYESYKLPIIRTRAFNHEGPRRDILGANASFAFQIAQIERGLSNQPVKVGNLEATRNFTDVRDIVRAYYLAMEKGDPGELSNWYPADLYNGRMSENTYFLVYKKENISYEVEESRVRPTELRNFIGNFEKFENKTGWKAEISFIDTMQSVLNYWRDFLDKKILM